MRANRSQYGISIWKRNLERKTTALKRAGQSMHCLWVATWCMQRFQWHLHITPVTPPHRNHVANLLRSIRKKCDFIIGKVTGWYRSDQGIGQTEYIFVLYPYYATTLIFNGITCCQLLDKTVLLPWTFCTWIPHLPSSVVPTLHQCWASTSDSETALVLCRQHRDQFLS